MLLQFYYCTILDHQYKSRETSLHSGESTTSKESSYNIIGQSNRQNKQMKIRRRGNSIIPMRVRELKTVRDTVFCPRRYNSSTAEWLSKARLQIICLGFRNTKGEGNDEARIVATGSLDRPRFQLLWKADMVATSSNVKACKERANCINGEGTINAALMIFQYIEWCVRV